MNLFTEEEARFWMWHVKNYGKESALLKLSTMVDNSGKGEYKVWNEIINEIYQEFF